MVFQFLPMQKNKTVSLGLILFCGGACLIQCDNLCGFCYSRAKQTTNTKCTLILRLPVLVYVLALSCFEARVMPEI